MVDAHEPEWISTTAVVAAAAEVAPVAVTRATPAVASATVAIRSEESKYMRFEVQRFVTLAVAWFAIHTLIPSKANPQG